MPPRSPSRAWLCPKCGEWRSGWYCGTCWRGKGQKGASSQPSGAQSHAAYKNQGAGGAWRSRSHGAGVAHSASADAAQSAATGAVPAAEWSQGQGRARSSSVDAAHSASWPHSQARPRSTSSGRRRERSLSRQRKTPAAALWGSWEQREALDRLRAAAKACAAAGDSEGVTVVETQVEAVHEAMYEALPMAARIAHWEGRREAQLGLISRLEELATLQRAKLAKTRAAHGAAQQDLAMHERKLTELAAEQAEQPSWGPGSVRAAPGSHDPCDSWDGYAWDYSSMAWVWKADGQSPPAAPPAAPAIALTDPYHLSDLALKDNLM